MGWLKPDVEKMEAEKDVKRLLRTLKYDEDDNVRYRAAEALRKIGWQPKNDDEKALYDKFLVKKKEWNESAKLEKPAAEPLIKPINESSKSKAIPNNLQNSIGMEFVLIPAGEFDMGPPSDEEGRMDDEWPIHRVKISKSFYMGKYEVTQKQWREVMGNNPSCFMGDNLPVESVSWNDVQEFIRKLNDKEGANKYRLPSEAEWEYAARAGTSTRYSFGNHEDDDYAWYIENSGGKTQPVGTRRPNPWGLYDMHGNVCEWVQDKWHNSYNGAPTDGSAWEGDDAQTSKTVPNARVFRGGSWESLARSLRSANRPYGAPGHRYKSIGFRLLREEAKRKEEKDEANKNELDKWIEELESIPEEYREELTDGLIRSLGSGKNKLSCICLLRTKDYFKTELDDNIKVKVRFTLTETPYNRPVSALYIKIFDSDNPAVDEMLPPRHEYLKRMLEQDYTYLLIADRDYKIYYRKKIYFDKILREDLNKIKKAFERYGEESGKTTLGEDPSWLYAMVWYQNNVSMEEIDRKYFSK